ncbi:unnamed protein product [Effrenium voratum]|nr:unnamed protein product [Effrenium voratum]
METHADPGIPRITAALLRKSCLENRGFETPDLNEVLILHYKGFRKIEGLDAYCNVRSLFLECNGISKIENLEGMPQLVSLYLQSNCIRRIENLEPLRELQYLNLSHNSICEVEGLGSLQRLDTLNLSANKFEDASQLRGLAERPTLRSVDVSCNYFEDGDSLLAFWAQNMPNVQCLYLHHNPCSRGLKDVRRRLISELRLLRWLDERPVTGLERAGCEAWASGGKEAELQAKQMHWQREKEEKEKSFQNFRKMQQAHAERAKARRAAQAPEARDQDAEPEKPPIREPLPRELHEAEAEEGEAGESRAADAVLAAARVFAPPPRKVDKPLAEPSPKAVTANESSAKETKDNESGNEDYNNFVKFLTTTMQAARRTILRSGRPQMSLKELPGNFERRFGTVFEKSRLGLQDHSDLAALLSFFPCFLVDRSNPSGPTVALRPGNKALAPKESVARMLFQRSRDLQPKKLQHILETYQKKSEETKARIAEVTKAKRTAREAQLEQEAKLRAAEAHSAAAPKSFPGMPPGLSAVEQQPLQLAIDRSVRALPAAQGKDPPGKAPPKAPQVVPPMKAPPLQPAQALQPEPASEPTPEPRMQQLLQEQQDLEKRAQEHMAQLVEQMQNLRQQVQRSQVPPNMLPQIQAQMQQLSQQHSLLQQQVSERRQQLAAELEKEKRKRRKQRRPPAKLPPRARGCRRFSNSCRVCSSSRRSWFASGTPAMPAL